MKHQPKALSPLVIVAYSMLPYALVGWAISRLIDSSFWAALGWLLATRLFFFVIEFSGSYLLWRFHGRHQMKAAMLAHLSQNKMPRRYYSHDDLLNYLARVANDEDAPVQAKTAARETELMAKFYESLGIVASARFHTATEAALEVYSPRASAPSIANVT